MPERAVKLKEFLDTHPNSKARPRAIELLISTHAGLGDQKLKNGDIAGGIEQMMLAIDEADTSISDKLFSGVIAQILAYRLSLRRSWRLAHVVVIGEHPVANALAWLWIRLIAVLTYVS